MPSVLYSTSCYIKNDLYRISIYVDDNDQNSNNTQSVTDSSEFTSTDILIEAVIPSLTRLNFESINDTKTTNIPKTIILNHILNIQQINVIPNRYKKNLYKSSETIDTNGTTTSRNKPSRQISCTTLTTNISQTSLPQIVPPRRQFSLGRFFSSQSNVDVEANLIIKTSIKLNYVDVSNSIRWTIKRLELEFEQENVANEFYNHLNLCLSTLKQRPRRLLIFINPFGGTGQAPTIYEKKILPIFNEANIIVTSIYTKHANHGQDYILNEDLSNYDGLICVGGDGMFAELCHGLLLRTSYQANLDINNPQVKIIRPDLRIGIIPAGSTDAICFGTTGLNDPVTSALQIIVGETLSIDVATVHSEKGFVRFMTIMLAYGFFGDIIHQSDKWRCLGPLRYDFAGFYHFLCNKSYHTELTITLSSNDSSDICQSQTGASMNNANNEVMSSVVIDSQQLSNNINIISPENNQINHPSEVIQNVVTPALIFCSKNCVTCAKGLTHNLNEIHEPLKIKCEGRYTTINCLNMPGRCAKSKFGMSPFVHLGDGTFDLMLVKRSWRTGFLRFLWQVANDGRSIEDLPNVERYRVSEVLIHPKHTDPMRLGNWACDGELISANEIQVRIHRQALNLFASGIQFDEIEEYTPIKKLITKRRFSWFQSKTAIDQEENN